MISRNAGAVFINTRRGTVALYALKPLLDSLNNAFGEGRPAAECGARQPQEGS